MKPIAIQISGNGAYQMTAAVAITKAMREYHLKLDNTVSLEETWLWLNGNVYDRVTFQLVFQHKDLLIALTFLCSVITKTFPTYFTGFSLSRCAGCWQPSSTAAPNGSWDT